MALTPTNVALLKKKGFGQVLVERGAGASADFLDSAYEQAGATLVDGAGDVWSKADIILKVRGPGMGEVDNIKEGQTIISLLQPAQNKELVDKIAARKATSFAMDMIPRISRAQVFDVLSSMANIAGYKAVLEASNVFGRFLTGQVTAAGKIPPCKVLVIGAGVAGLSAIATARRMGAIVRGFDTRPAAREQVQSLGAEFIEVELKEDGSGAGGYAKEMSKEFIDAEMNLFKEQAKDVDIIITTALIPGKPAPKLITKDMLDIMKPGSVIVDLAAEAGGNCEATKKGELATYNDVKVIGMVCIHDSKAIANHRQDTLICRLDSLHSRQPSTPTISQSSSCLWPPKKRALALTFPMRLFVVPLSLRMAKSCLQSLVQPRHRHQLRLKLPKRSPNLLL